MQFVIEHAELLNIEITMFGIYWVKLNILLRLISSFFSF